MNYSKKETWYQFVCYFFIFCLIGWIYEACWGVYNHSVAGNLAESVPKILSRGFLHGPYLPVYGFGGVLLVATMKPLLDMQKNIFWKIFMPIIVFIAIMLMVSAVEFIASIILEKCFNMELWNYSKDKFNIQGRVSLRNSTLLSIGGMFFVYILHPLLRKLFSRINNKVLIVVAIIIIIGMGTDLILTVL